jgi:hypothetical protein
MGGLNPMVPGHRTVWLDSSRLHPMVPGHRPVWLDSSRLIPMVSGHQTTWPHSRVRSTNVCAGKFYDSAISGTLPLLSCLECFNTLLGKVEVTVWAACGVQHAMCRARDGCTANARMWK